MVAIKQTPAVPDTTTGAPVSNEQAADFAALQAMASGDPAAPAPAADPDVPDYSVEAAGMVDMVAALIVGYEPKCAPHWGDDRKANISAALAPVLEKYNFTLGNIPPELTLLVMAAPPLYLSMRIIADGMNNAKPPAAPQKSAPVVVPKDPAALDVATHSPEMMAVL